MEHSLFHGLVYAWEDINTTYGFNIKWVEVAGSQYSPWWVTTHLHKTLQRDAQLNPKV